jgi:hypothetical protein
LSDSTLLDGVPFGTIPQTPNPTSAIGSIGVWMLTAKSRDIQSLPQSLRTQVTSGGNTFYRLNPGAIQDIFIVCHFTTA